MDPLEEHLLNLTRRRFFAKTASSVGATLGSFALASLLTPGSLARGAGETDAARAAASFVPRLGPHCAEAKRVIYMHMEGAC